VSLGTMDSVLLHAGVDHSAVQARVQEQYGY